MATVFRSPFYVPRPSDDFIWSPRTPVAANINLILAPPVASNIPVSPFYVPRPSDDFIWSWASPLLGRNNQTFGVKVQSPLTVSVPPWRFTYDDPPSWAPTLDNLNSSIIIDYYTKQKFFGAPGQVPTFRWQPYLNYDVADSALWWEDKPEWRNSAVLQILTNQKFFGAGGQVPTKRWSPYITPDDSTHWLIAFGQNMMTNTTVRLPLGTPFVETRWIFNSYEDAPPWAPTPDNLDSAIISAFTAQKFFGAGGQVPAKTWSWNYTQDDSAYWQYGAQPASSKTLIPQLTSGPVKFQREWLFGYDDSSGWQYLNTVPVRNLNITTITATPIVVNVPPWRFTYDDPPYWVGSPLASEAIPLLTQQKFFGAGGQAPTKGWSSYMTPDDSAHWLVAIGNMLLNTTIHLPAVTNPFFNLPFNWKYSFDDFSGWQGKPTSSQTLIPQLSFGPVNFQREWLFGYDDSSGWQYFGSVPERNLSIYTITQTPITVNVPPWRFVYDDSSYWQGQPTASQLLVPELTSGPVKFQREWLFGYDDPSYWQAGTQPASSKILIPQSAFGPVNFQREWLFGYEDPSGWQYLGTVPLRNLSIDTITLTPITVNVPPWRFLQDDSSYWQGKPVSSATLIPQSSFGPVKFQREWLFGYDDPAFWLGKSTAVPSLDLPAATPFESGTRQWLFGYDDPAFWQGNPLSSKVLVPLLTAAGQVHNKQWLFGYDDPAYWLGTPVKSQLIPLVTGQSPVQFQREWLFGLDDHSYWVGTPTRSSLLVPILTAAGQVKWQREWLFGYDDPAFWPGALAAPQPSRTLIPLLTAAGQVHNKQWLFGYEDPAFWVGHPFANFVPITPPAKLKPFLNLPLWFWGDDYSFWVGKSFRSNALAYPRLIIDPRFIAAPNNLLPTNFGAGRYVWVTPQPNRNFLIRGTLAPNMQLPSSRGANRTFITTPKVTGMPLGNDLSVIDPTIEKVTLTFNFAPWLNAGVTITNVVSVTATVAATSLGIDPNPQGIIFGPAVIGPSPLPPNAAGAAVLQQVSGCLGGVIYLLQCLVDTSDNQQLNLATHLPCATLQ